MGTTKKGDRERALAAVSGRKSEVSADQALAQYVDDLNNQYGGYARVIGDVRSIIDSAMGQTSLTDLLYKSRNEDETR